VVHCHLVCRGVMAYWLSYDNLTIDVLRGAPTCSVATKSCL
jgi:hypothetical protein